MLDVALELENFQPVDLEEIGVQAGKLPEDTVEAIQLFNKALEDMHSGNEDMAIIALKKSISLYPTFYEAMNLLGLCLYAAGKEDSARSVFRRVIDTDDSGIKALQYTNQINDTDEQSDSNANKNSKNNNKKQQKNASVSSDNGLFSTWLAKGLQSEDNSLYGLKYILGILIGIVMVGLVWYMVPTDKSLFSIKRIEKVSQDPELLNQIEQLNGRIEKLEQDLDGRKEENLKLMDSFQIYKDWIARLEEAENEFLEGNYIQSAEMFLDSQGKGIPDDLKNKYQVLWDKIRVKAAEHYYQKGSQLYTGNTDKTIDVYRESLAQFESALNLIEDEDVSYLAPLYYQAGKAAARCGESERALELFEYLVNNFSNSTYSSYATSRINEIKRGEPISGN